MTEHGVADAGGVRGAGEGRSWKTRARVVEVAKNGIEGVGPVVSSVQYEPARWRIGGVKGGAEGRRVQQRDCACGYVGFEEVDSGAVDAASCFAYVRAGVEEVLVKGLDMPKHLDDRVEKTVLPPSVQQALLGVAGSPVHNRHGQREKGWRGPRPPPGRGGV